MRLLRQLVDLDGFFARVLAPAVVRLPRVGVELLVVLVERVITNKNNKE